MIILMAVDIKVGDVLHDGRYEVQRPLGGGRDKKVYLAHDRHFKCQVALDVFSGENAARAGLTANAWEAQVLGQLGDHPNIASVVERWNEGGTAFMTTRYLAGGSLRDLIARSRDSGEHLPVDEILRISIEITSGLAHIHGGRILYLDLQPRNVFFDRWCQVHLVDFDTAAYLDDGDIPDQSHRDVIDYMAPS
jgi:eukaryotic-like serine/threonine-protein kinase